MTIVYYIAAALAAMALVMALLMQAQCRRDQKPKQPEPWQKNRDELIARRDAILALRMDSRLAAIDQEYRAVFCRRLR